MSHVLTTAVHEDQFKLSAKGTDVAVLIVSREPCCCRTPYEFGAAVGMVTSRDFTGTGKYDGTNRALMRRYQWRKLGVIVH